MQNKSVNDGNEIYPGFVLDRGMLKKLLNNFCSTARVFALLTDGQGQWITDLIGDVEEVERIKSYIPVKKFQHMIDYVMTSKIEDQIIEDTDYPNIKVAAIAIKTKGKSVLNGLVCGVISDATTEGFVNEPVEGFQTTVTSKQFIEAVDFSHIFVKQIVENKIQLLDELATNKKMHSSQMEMTESLRRNDTLTSILQLLESEDNIERVLSEIIGYAGKYLDISSAQIFQMHQHDNRMNVMSEWIGQGFFSIFDKTQNIDIPKFLRQEAVTVVSSNKVISEEMQKSLQEYHIKATIIIPIYIKDRISMYACFNECRENRIWGIEDIRFASDVTKIVQSIITSRVHQNSIASSYHSIQGVLDNVGSAVYVWDPKKEKVIYLNREMRNMFARKKDDVTDVEFFDTFSYGYEVGVYEHHDPDLQEWYEIHVNELQWVDGRDVVFCSIYDITDKKLSQRKIEEQAYTDFLTGLYNRMCLERDLARYIDDTKNEGTLGALLYLDLDDFKHINDGLGHQYGDVLLKGISHSLQRISGIESSCYRMGGDEFVILVPPEYYPRFTLIQEEIKEIFAKPWFLKDADYYCTMSMGTVTFPKDGDNVQDLIKKADIAMYDAKKSGKNRVAHFSDQLDSSSNARLDMEKNMRDATTEKIDEFEVYYQPVIDIQKSDLPCTGAEALVRWNSSELGFLTPGSFIPLAEYLGLISQIGNHVMKMACIECKKWNENGHPDYKVNVNLSVVQLLQNDMVEVIRKTLEETEVNPKNLTLEVTESLAIDDMDRMQKILDNIKKLGVRLALDDFGTGYSSLNHIRQIPVDVIKVDQTFVKELAEDSYSQAFIKMVAELANTIGVSICVEGIETEAQYKVLEGMKVRLVQGYYFGKPMKKGEFEAKYVFGQKESK